MPRVGLTCQEIHLVCSQCLIVARPELWACLLLRQDLFKRARGASSFRGILGIIVAAIISRNK